MSASDHLSRDQFFDVPNVFHAGSRPGDLPYRGGKRQTLPPDHPLLATQDWLDKRSVRDLQDPETREGADQEEGAPPRVSRYQGQDYIFDGHHRIAADRLAGRSTKVLFHGGED